MRMSLTYRGQAHFSNQCHWFPYTSAEGGKIHYLPHFTERITIQIAQSSLSSMQGFLTAHLSTLYTKFM